MADEAVDLFEADDALELTRIDSALDKATRAESQETALAALASATAGINAFAARQVVAVSDTSSAAAPAAGSKAAAVQGYFIYARSPIAFGSRPGKAKADRQSDIETRLERYWTATQSVVKRFGPTQYQISLGFPLVISVSFTWDVPRS